MRNVLVLLGLVAGVFMAPGALPAQTVEPTPVPPPIIVPPCPLDCWWPIIPVAQLDRLEIDASVRTASITTRYTLRLSNPADWQAEGRIVVPVPPDSAVVDLALSDGSQTLEGKLLDADEAQRLYDEIVARRIDPALLRSLEDDLYEVRAFPVPPGEQREVRFTVVTPLTTVGDQVDLQVPWSRMSPRPATALVTVDIDVPWEVRGVIAPGFPLETVRSGSGQVVVSWESPAKWLAGADFHLYITGGADLLATRLLAYRLAVAGWLFRVALRSGRGDRRPGGPRRRARTRYLRLHGGRQTGPSAGRRHRHPDAPGGRGPLRHRRLRQPDPPLR